jgi:hypothetical protein
MYLMKRTKKKLLILFASFQIPYVERKNNFFLSIDDPIIFIVTLVYFLNKFYQQNF